MRYLLDRDSFPTIAAAVLSCAIPCAVALYQFRAEISPDFFTVLWYVTTFFFVAVLIRQSVSLWKGGGEVPNTSGQRTTQVFGLALALAVTTFAYARTVPLYFTADDFYVLDLVRQPFSVSIWPQFTHGQVGANFYRPLGFLSLFIDYQLWHTWAPGYHLTNLLVHLLCVAALFCLCRELLLTDETCTVTAILFGILPATTQAVAWIVCRFDLLATLFMLWSLVFAARFRGTRRPGAYVLAMAFFLLSSLCKESAYVLPVLWIALEFLPLQEQRQRAFSFAHRLLALSGYVAIAGLAFLQRWFLLGGIGGPQQSNGAHSVMALGKESLKGVLVRGPSAMLLGNNVVHEALSSAIFRQSSLLPFLILVLMTATLLLAMAVLSIGTRSYRQLISFSLVWVFSSIVPVHYYFAAPTSGINNARVLYSGAAGMALLLALLLYSTFDLPKLRLAWAFVLGALLFMGLERNISAWQRDSETVVKLLADLKEVNPTPQPGTAFYLAKLPEMVNGVPFFTCCLQPAVRFDYGYRQDITAAKLTDSNYKSVAPMPNAVLVAWYDEDTSKYVFLGHARDPKVVRLK